MLRMYVWHWRKTVSYRRRWRKFPVTAYRLRVWQHHFIKHPVNWLMPELHHSQSAACVCLRLQCQRASGMVPWFVILISQGCVRRAHKAAIASHPFRSILFPWANYVTMAFLICVFDCMYLMKIRVCRCLSASSLCWRDWHFIKFWA